MTQLNSRLFQSRQRRRIKVQQRLPLPASPLLKQP
jgi:hypothetical protein